MPLPPQRPAGLGGGAGAGTVVNNHMTINGAGKNPKELADDVQRHISEAMNNRGHEIEPELA